MGPEPLFPITALDLDRKTCAFCAVLGGTGHRTLTEAIIDPVQRFVQIVAFVHPGIVEECRLAGVDNF